MYLPDSLGRIGDYAFFANSALNEVFWGRSLKYIGAHAFEATPEMDVLNFNGSLISIGDYAFAYSGFYKVYFPLSLREFNPTAFSNTENISVIMCSYNHPAFVTENNVLYTKDKSKLLLASKNPTEDYVIPEETKVIEDYAFMLLDESISVTLHDNLERIGKDAFEYTKYTAGTPDTCYVGNYLIASYVNDLVVKEGTLGIADDSLHEVTGLVVPESLRFIGDSLEHIGRIDIPSIEVWCNMDLQHPESGEVYLQNCISIYMNNACLTEIEIPYSIETLKAYRFGDCSTLKKVIIPPSVTTIEDNAFFNFSENLVIHCLEGSVACSYAHANNITCSELSVASKPGSNIDYSNKIIYTSTYNTKDISRLIYIAESKTAVALGSDYVNGKHILGTGSTVTVYGDNEREDFTLIVTGDVNGDSVCDVLDITRIGLDANEHKQLTDSYLLAGDMNADEEITVEDYAQVVNLALAG